jgi:D-methionine transport system substrate-binding protein
MDTGAINVMKTSMQPTANATMKETRQSSLNKSLKQSMEHSMRYSMRQYLRTTVLLLGILLIAAGCGQGNDKQEGAQGGAVTDTPKQEETHIKVASLIPPMTEVLELVKPKLEEEGIHMEIVVLSDNTQPNTALKNKEVDANFFQHTPYMKSFNENNDATLAPVREIYHAIYGAYSKRYASIEELPDGASIGIANDPANTGRTLALLDKAGLIKLADGVGYNGTMEDIVDNARGFKFQEVDLLMLARVIDDLDLVAMYPAYAKPLNLTPKDALIVEGEESPFAITLVAREDNKDSAAIQRLAELMTSEEVKTFFEENYGDSVMPAFK